MNRIRELLNKLLPTIDDLPQCWRIVWFGKKLIIPKKW